MKLELIQFLKKELKTDLLSAGCGEINVYCRYNKDNVKTIYNKLNIKEQQSVENLYLNYKFLINGIHLYDFASIIILGYIPKKRKFYSYKKEKTSYRRFSDIKRKEKNIKEIDKKHWYKINKFKKERSMKKRVDWDAYERSFNNKSLRRWVKNRIKQEDYSLIIGWKKYNHFRTEWFW